MPKFSDYTELAATASDDLFVVVDVSAGETKKIQASNMPGGGGAITTLLPLAQVIENGPTFNVSDGPQPVVFDPASTVYSDRGWGWWEFQPNLATFWTAYGDLDADGACVINAAAGQDQVSVQVTQWNHSGAATMVCNSSEASVSVRAVTGQTNPMLSLTASAGGTAKFSVGPNGEITHCNGVVVPITGVAVNAAAIHAAGVTLGLWTT